MIATTLQPTSGMKCIQHILLAFNALFTFTGVILISVGSTVKSIFYDYAAFVESRFFSPSVVIISVGCLVFVVALFGCYGALKLSVAAITMYCSLLAVIFIVEMVVGVVAFMMQDQIGIMLARTFNQTIYDYETDPVAEATIDALQNEFYCCGGQGPGDWLPVVRTTSDSEIILPLSCCAIYEKKENICIAIKRMGCLPQLTYLLDQSSLLLTTTILIIALMQLLGVVFASKLGSQLRGQKSLRDRFKYEVKENVIIGSMFAQNKIEPPSPEYSRLPSYTELFGINETSEKEKAETN